MEKQVLPPPKPRAERRHHLNRIKARRRDYWGMKWRNNGPFRHPRFLGMVSHTPKPCSCFTCRNLRTSEGPTLAERRSSLSMLEQWREWCDACGE